MKYLVSLNGKQYEVIVEHHTANVTNVTSFVSEQSQKGPSIDNKQTDDFPLSGTLPANSTAVKAPLPGTITKLNEKWSKYKTRRNNMHFGGHENGK